MEYNYTHSSTILNWTEQSVVSCIAWCCAHGLCPLERLLGNRKRYGAKGHGRIWCLVVKDHMKSFCQIRINDSDGALYARGFDNIALIRPRPLRCTTCRTITRSSACFAALVAIREPAWFQEQLFLQTVETLGAWPATRINTPWICYDFAIFWTSLVTYCHIVQVQPCRALWTSHSVGQCDSWTCYEILAVAVTIKKLFLPK